MPLARPPPARPPVIHDSEQNIKALRARIVYLEKALDARNNEMAAKREPTADVLSPSSSSSYTRTPVSSDATSPSTSPPPVRSPSSDPSTEDEWEPPIAPLFHLAPSAYATTSTLAQLALGHHGEFIGRGSLICALYSVGRRSFPDLSCSSCHYSADQHGKHISVPLCELHRFNISIPRG